MPASVCETHLSQTQILDDEEGFDCHGVPTSLEFTKAQSPNGGHSGGSRGASTPGSTGKSPLKDSYWFAHAAEGDHLFPNAGTGDCADEDGTGGFTQKDREERLRLLRERQSEERQRRLEELKQAAIHAQKVREQQEEDRRRKIDELRTRDYERRSLVEERKKQIWEAEKERRENLLRKNMERDARIEAKRNANRSSIGFAFGSSTPRLFEVESGYFGNRRVASQGSVMSASMTNGGSSRNSVERDVDIPHKRRLENKPEKELESIPSSDLRSPCFSEDSLEQFPYDSSHNNVDSVPSKEEQDECSELKTESLYTSSTPFYRANRFAGNLTGSGVFVGEDLMTRSCSALGAPPVRGRRKTDLIPTIPVHDSPRTQSPATRTTPSSPSRPNSSLSQQSLSSHTSQNSTVSMRAKGAARRASRPLSIAGSAPDSVVTADQRQGRSTERKGVVPPTGKTPRAKSVGERVIGDASFTVAKPPPAAKKPIGNSRISSARPLTATTNSNSPKEKPKIAPKPNMKMIAKSSPKQSPTVEQLPCFPLSPLLPQPVSIQSSIPVEHEEMKKQDNENKEEMPTGVTQPISVEDVPVNDLKEMGSEPALSEKDKQQNADIVPTSEENPTETGTAITGKPRITNEEEAKAALAERRRLAREQAEREAEMERLRLEELKRQEEERIRLEEEERLRWEKEQDQLRKIEVERIQKAIEEQAQREEEERKKRDEEAKLRAEREEQEKKAREEQERIRRETEERLRKEEEERAERRKRVEAIMSRTRGKGGTGATPVTTPTKTQVDLPGSKVNNTTNDEANESNPMQTSLITDSLSMNMTDAQQQLMSTSMPSMPTTQPDLLGDIPNISDESSVNNEINSNNEENHIPVHTNGLSSANVVGMNHHLIDKVAETNTADDVLVDDFATLEIVNQKLPVSSARTNSDFEQLIDLSVCPTTTTTTNPFSKGEEFLNNADSVNSNIPSNGPTPFIAFEDNFSKKQETNMTDLLS